MTPAPPRSLPSSRPLPGRTPAEAATAFLEPLQDALGCIVRGKIVPSSGGRHVAGVLHAWSLNGVDGARLSSGHVLKAGMQYEIIKDERGEPWRVTTRGYMYSVENEHGQELLSAHWHPDTSGPHKRPHLHFPGRLEGTELGFLGREPINTGRVTFEEVVRFAVRNLGADAMHEDWEARLLLAETPHKLYRSWHEEPEEVQRSSRAAEVPPST